MQLERIPLDHCAMFHPRQQTHCILEPCMRSQIQVRKSRILSCGGTQQNAEAYTSVRGIKLLLPSTYAALVTNLSRITVMVTVTVIRSGCNRVTAAVRCCSASQTASDARCRPSDAAAVNHRVPPCLPRKNLTLLDGTMRRASSHTSCPTPPRHRRPRRRRRPHPGGGGVIGCRRRPHRHPRPRRSV